MKKNNFLLFLFIFCSFFSLSQEEKSMTKTELKKNFFSNSNYKNSSFNSEDLKNFEITSFDALGNKIPLCINNNLEISLDCKSKIKYAQIINSTIYDLDMNKIGHCFFGKITEKDINSFWNSLKHWKGNITIYDKTETYRLATFMFLKPTKDYFAIMNLDTTVMNLDKIETYKKLLVEYNNHLSKYPDDKKIIEKKEDIEDDYNKISRNNLKKLNKSYKSLLKNFNINKYPDDLEVLEKNQEIEEAYLAVLKKIDPNYRDETNWLEIFFSKNRRSIWSQDEGYVPYTKRERKDSNPISQEKMERYPYLEE